MTSPRPVLRTVAAVLISLTLAATLAGCGEDANEVDPELQSSADTEMEVVEHGDARYAVGRGVLVEMPEGWTDYEAEKVSTDGTTYEWAVGMPADTRPLPAGIQFSMGRAGKGAPFAELAEGTRELAEMSPGYRLVDEGDLEVDGAERAAFVRFERELDIGDGPVLVEQLQLILEMPAGEVSVLRFIGEAGKWEEQVGKAYDSLVVTERAAS